MGARYEFDRRFPEVDFDDLDLPSTGTLPSPSRVAPATAGRATAGSRDGPSGTTTGAELSLGASVVGRLRTRTNDEGRSREFVPIPLESASRTDENLARLTTRQSRFQ